MKLKKNAEQSVLEDFYLRSARGLWVRGEIRGDSILVYCHRWHEVRGGKIYELSPDKEIIRSGPIHGFEWGDSWGLMGEIRLTDRLAGMCDPVKFSEFSYSMMVHAVSLISLGYGDTPSDVMGWFEDGSFEFLEGADLRFVKDSGQFVGLAGKNVHVEIGLESDPPKLVATIDVAKDQFDVEVGFDRDLVDLVIATVPV